MSKSSDIIGSGLPADNREVGAMITYRLMPKKNATEAEQDGLLSTKSISDIFGISSSFEDNSGTLIVRRPWYGFDRCSIMDDELFDLSDTSIRDDGSLARFGKLLNLGNNFKAVSSAFERAQEDMPHLLSEGEVSKIHLTFKDGEDPEKKIQTMVPLDKLKKITYAFWKLTRKNSTRIH